MLPDRGRIDPSSWPLYPPERYFDLPDQLPDDLYAHVEIDGPDAGRVYGWVHHAGTMLLGSPGGPFTPDPSPSGLHDCQLGQTPTLEGTTVRTANVGGGVNHAPVTSGYREAVKHYENTASQTMRVRYHYVDTPSGKTLAYSGALWPDLTERDVLTVLASGLSGDWRYRPEYSAYDFCGSQLVSNPGLPLRRVAGAGGADHPAIVGPGACEGESCSVCDTPVLTSGARLDDIEQALGEFAIHLGYEILPARTAAICEPLDIDSRILECEDALDVLVRAAAAEFIQGPDGKFQGSKGSGEPHTPAERAKAAQLLAHARGTPAQMEAQRAQLLAELPDKELGVALDRWTGGHYDAMGHEADLALQGKPVENTMSQRDSAVAMMQAAAASPPTTEEVYRGIASADAERLAPLLNEGGTVDLPLAAFSDDRAIADQFMATTPDGVDDAFADATHVIVAVEPGARMLSVAPVSAFPEEKELVASGRFEVVSTEQRYDLWAGLPGGPPGPGYTYVTLRQVGAFDV